jgi:hypothetical protein
MEFTFEERLALMPPDKAANVRAAIEAFKAAQHEKRDPMVQHERRMELQAVRRARRRSQAVNARPTNAPARTPLSGQRNARALNIIPTPTNSPVNPRAKMLSRSGGVDNPVLFRLDRSIRNIPIAKLSPVNVTHTQSEAVPMRRAYPKF